MTTAALLVAAVSIASLYDTAFNQHRLRLIDTVKTQAGFIEAIVRIAKPQNNNSLESGFETSDIEQLIKSQIRLEQFGKSGEFNLFRMLDNTIEFVISKGADASGTPRPIPFAGEWAEAMKLALSGKSGTLIGPDYRGRQVLAAFEPVPVVGMGLVAKIDMSEIRAPFIRAGLIALALAILVILVAASIFWWLSQSVVRQLAQQAETFQTLVNTAREGIILIDEHSSIQFVNPAAETLFGYSQGE
ncbi:MAG: PAS domain-containing protein, partial [Gammaproteobacteria bacterium]